jgi:acyl transferase domain-containing protein/NAD(P)-dependent dehydrogenase (short-subunit alcohol dehydrogenase family)
MSSEFLERIGKLSPKRLALLALELHEQVEAARQREPIAVIGIGCRFPGGANDPDAYWALLRDGRDGIREVPPERWDIDAWFDADVDAPGKMSVRQGGFLDRVDGFDAAFFGISPREALTMDPQQRLVLEVAWEALEHAGLSPERLVGSATGVYLGVCNSDHYQRVVDRGSEAIDAYLASGNAPSVVSGRVSYLLGLQGPAVSIDTACSSSLVALHLAVQSLRSGETRVALAGGVNVMCSPQTTIALTKAHMLAPDGRCKTFDAAADGFARGEGCGVVVLKRLADARADGDRVLAVIRGSAANQDGRSGGLTVPNGPAQEAVIRAALADAQLQPADIDYVEAHGTGTTLGDPIEVRALAGALGTGRSEPLLIGSVKTNIGHLESAAGIAGVIKVVLSLLHERIPPHLHFKQPSPHIAWAEYPVRVHAEGRAWLRGAKRRLAGVSSFGFSGTNAHVVIEEAPAPERVAATAARPLHCLPLSARSESALRELAPRYVEALSAGTPLPDVAHTAGVGRSHFAERLAVVAADAATAREALTAFVRGDDHPALHRGTAEPGRPSEVVFLFTGQGSQYPGMAQALYERSPVFRDVIDRCDALLGADTQGRTLRSVLQAGAAENAPIHETMWTQPALFAVEVGLAQLWRAWGIEPAAVIGHSVGEYAAACIAGVFSLEDGLRLIRERGRLMQALPPGGAMAAVFASEAEVADALAPWADRLAIAAVNAPDSVVVSGDAQALDGLLALLAGRNVQGQRLFVSVAGHSPFVEPVLQAIEDAARKVTMQAPRIPLAWNVAGGVRDGAAPDAVYWRRHLREPVRFADGIAALHRDGYRSFLEVGPHPTLIALAERSLPAGGARFVTSLRRAHDDWHELMHALAALYVHGAAIDWAGVDGPYRPSRVSLPTYPFERRSFWITPAPAHGYRPPPQRRDAHPLLGARLPTAVPTFEATLLADRPAYLGEHRVLDKPLIAAPVFLEIAQAGALEAFGVARRAARQFVIHEPLVLPAEGRTVQLHFVERDGALQFAIHGRAEGGTEWRLHASGELVPAADELHGGAISLADIERALGAAQGCDAHYAKLAALGIDLGPAFRSLQQAHCRDGEALARIVLPAANVTDPVAWVHPGLLDGALQAVGLALSSSGTADDLFLLTEIAQLRLAAPLPAALWCRVRLCAPQGADERRADVTLRGDGGATLGIIAGVVLRRATRSALQRVLGAPADSGLFYEVIWEAVPTAVRAAPSLRPPHHWIASVRERFSSLALVHGMSVYEQLLPELDRLAADHAADALQRLGFDATPGRRFDLGGEAARLGVAQQHRRLFGRLLSMLAEDDVLRTDDGVFEVRGGLRSTDPARRYDVSLQRFAHVDGELRTLRRCGGELARVLRGEQDPLQLLFPDGSFAEARKLYVESPFARTYNAALGEALRAASAALPPSARLRVLEIGAGTGGTTSYLLPLLAPDRCDYTFTDLSPLFLERAIEQFRDYPFVQHALLDIERDPLEQGFEAGRYDVVVAGNVLHATADLERALMHARQLLAPGGLLLLLEGVAPERWVDLTFGLTEGWWRFADGSLRPDYPLIGRDAWLALLERLGFTGVGAVPEQAHKRGLAQQALIVARAPLVPRRWTLVGGPARLAEALSQRLCERGDLVSLLAADAVDAPLPGGDALVYLGALETAGAPDEPSAVRLCKSLSCELPLRWLSRLASDAAAGRAWLVTQGAHSAGGAPEFGARWQQPLWGLGRVFALEQPARWGGAIDLPPGMPPNVLADTLLQALDNDDAEEQTAWRDGQRFGCRLVPAPAPTAPPVRFRADATYLVTGGFGGLGLLVARWMAERGARHLALLGRHPDRDAAAVREIEALGARVIALQGDVADEPTMRRLVQELALQHPPLRGVMHAAADLSAGPIGELSFADVERMLRPKIDGTLVLERLARHHELDFLVLFSSTTALLGAAGLAHYAAANLFLDATAQSAAAPCRVLSVNWGTWEKMRLATADSQRAFREAGLEPMQAAAALDALARLLGSSQRQAVVAQIDWSVLKPLHEARRARPLLSRLDAAPTTKRQAAPMTTGPRLAERIAAAVPSMQRELLDAFVREQVAAVLGLDDASAVPVDTGLFEMGMDSLMSVELKRRLERGIEHALPSTLTFNYPNVGALTAFLARELRVSEPTARTPLPIDGGENGDDGELDRLSDDELEARLLARLEQTR